MGATLGDHRFHRRCPDLAAPAHPAGRRPATRQHHRAFSDTLQRRFLDALQDEGWPISGFTRHTQIFQRAVAPALSEGRRIAYFLVDALRYELAAEFRQRLPDTLKATLEPALAQIPTITPVGMAALLPGAHGKLRLQTEGDSLTPYIGDTRVASAAERIAHVQRLHGDRVAAMDLDDLLKTRKPRLKDTVHLRLIKTTEIDTAGEHMADAALGIMQGVLEKFLRAVKVLQDLDFREAVFAADHGFLLLSEQLPGDKVEKPRGQWPLSKIRCLAGSGGAATGSLRFAPEDLGLDGDLQDVVVPDSLGAFRTGETFMHSGLSLPECLIPVLSLSLGKATASPRPSSQLQLQYRGGKTRRITTKTPMIEVILFQQEMFATPLSFRLEARAGKKPIAQVAAAPQVDPTTGLVSIEPGAAVKIPLRMAEDFEGKFTVHAIDPLTQASHATLDLQTDYL